MNFRLADLSDLNELQEMYRLIVKQMKENQIMMWDDVYPCEFIEDDIKNRQMYILTFKKEIIAAFALCESDEGEKSISWESDACRACYLDRLAVHVDYHRKGIGSIMVHEAKRQAKSLKMDYLRLFVVEENQSAIQLYEKTGFSKAGGSYDLIIDDELILHEFGYEIRL